MRYSRETRMLQTTDFFAIFSLMTRTGMSHTRTVTYQAILEFTLHQCNIFCLNTSLHILYSTSPAEPPLQTPYKSQAPHPYMRHCKVLFISCSVVHPLLNLHYECHTKYKHHIQVHHITTSHYKIQYSSLPVYQFPYLIYK